MRDNKGSDHSISLRGLIDFYEDLLKKGTIEINSSAHIRLQLLKEQHKQRDNKYYKGTQKSIYNRKYREKNK